MRLREALDQSPAAALRRLARAHNVAFDDATTPAELIEALAAKLGSAEYATTLLGSLNERERSVLSHAQRGGGEVRGVLLARLLGSEDAARPLLDRGLLFRTFSPLGPHRGEVFAVPDELLGLLPAEGSQAGTVTAFPPPVDAPPPER